MKDFDSGKYINQGAYKSFQPNKINREWKLESIELIDLLSKADRQLGRLDMYSEYIPNINLFIRMHIFKEATQSSKIEGTKTNIEEALLDKENIKQEKRDDWEEVQNYIKALNIAIEDLDKIPFSTRIIKKIHKILLQGVRGKHKNPGEFRKSQNWIGGATIRDAIFVPPVHTSIASYMSDLEKFVHNQGIHFPDLLKIALVHYQFETIHPFLDGNGRVGRLLITLYLIDKGILKKPILYLSDFFERNRQLYYDNLMLVREKNKIEQWYKFFMVGIIDIAKNSIDTFDNILKLREKSENKIRNLGSRANNARKILDYLFEQPIINAKKAKETTGLSFPTIYSIISDMEKLEIIQEMTGDKRGRTYFFKDYIDLFR